MASASGAETTTPLLEAKGVSKTFGPVHALSEVDFAVNAGEVVVLVGDNGAGKSTLVKIIAGIHRPDVVLRLGQIAGSFDAHATSKKEIVAAITGAGGLEPALVEPEPAAN